MRGRDSLGKIEDLDPDDHAFAAVVENHPGRDFLALRDETFVEREAQRVRNTVLGKPARLAAAPEESSPSS